MWHKLREIFGYKDSRNRQVEVKENKIDQASENIQIQATTDQSQKSEGKVNSTGKQSVSGTSDVSVSQSDSVDSSSTWEKIKDKWTDDCLECRVTVSVFTFGLMAHICRTLWLRRMLVPPHKRKYIAIANLSLFGMWLAYIKKEWYDEKVTESEQQKKTFSWDIFER
ncbi:uncharacterized protein LOC123542870 [Mercenaria mercenaria]|uniref:uncharacterized protein LOC123542870 n=1 Tax=Mercenaria mercenaria TaxID=6596 RepID=UPI00234EAF2B|nr:uncharacterized protein LOC123542870 [Mercenaria mercenaria]XP_053399043.1 uncharacterized protein LOC123542870 [Mercenaria mercenaria]XP_053399052.1 uncharacterized protein LOC123542870 [Mercenaria mercenaria]